MQRSELWLWFMHGALSGVQPSVTSDLFVANAAKRADHAIEEFEKRFGSAAVTDDRTV